MGFDERTGAALEVALNESEVLGLRISPADLACELLLHVCAQPEREPVDADPRRVLRLRGATRVRVLLREEAGDRGLEAGRRHAPLP